MKFKIFYTGVVLSLICARAEFFVAPSDREAESGNLQWLPGFNGPGNFQLVYTARNFQGPVSISGISFRLDEGTGGLSFDAVIPKVTVRMSTYSGTIASFNPSLYSQNKGSDDRLVFDADVSWHAKDNLGPSPNGFDLAIVFSQPFIYDPSAGALLISYAVQSVSGNMAADAHGHNDPSIGWVSTGSIGIASLVTRFQVTPVPEASTFSLFTFGFATLFGLFRRK
jgi:hypothetical protein